MKFIELKQGLSVRVSDIESMQVDPDNGGTRVTMRSGAIYETAFQFLHLLQLIEVEINTNHEQTVESNLENQFFNG